MDDFTINTVDTDYRAETLLAGLIENGRDAAETHLIREKGDRRGVLKDIDKVETKYDDAGFDIVEYLCVYTNRKGIYDSLPEGVFHQSSNPKRQKSQEEILHEIKTQREEEFFARKYFQPFEMVLDKILVDIQRYEQKYNKPHLYQNLTGMFEEYWDILKYLTTAQALLFIKAIPVMEDISRSLDSTAKVMEIILDCPVSIREGKKSEHRLTSGEATGLGKWRLGVNAIVGKSVAGDSVDLEITVGPASPEKIKGFLPGQINDRILKSLIELTVPFDRYTAVKYRVTETEKKFRLSGDTHKAWLGINTTI
jgi:hypothetical protein